MAVKISQQSSTSILLGILACVVIAIVIVMASVPPVSRDALTHHLLVPKIWLEKGLLSELPSVPFSYYPMNLDLLYVIPLYFGNDIIPKYIHYAFALLTSFLIFRYLKKRLSTRYALLGGLFFLSIPVVVKLSVTVYVDLGLIFFSTAALLSLLDWMEDNYRFKHMLLSALYCGLALGTKYNGLIVFFILSCFVPFMYLRKFNEKILKKSLAIQARAAGWMMLFVVLSLVVFSPWMGRNTLLTGNPVYPLFNGFFKQARFQNDVATAEDPSIAPRTNVQQQKTPWRNFAIRKLIYGESLWQIGLIPLRIFFEGKDDNPKHFDGRLSPFLLFLPLLLSLPGSKLDTQVSIECRFLALFAIGYLIIVFFKVDMRIRWVGPMIPPLIILSMIGLSRLQMWSEKLIPRLSAVVVGCIVCGMLLLNASYIHALYGKIEPMNFIAGRIDRDSYIKKFRPEYEVINFANQYLDGSASILALFIGNRIYYFNRDVETDIKILRESASCSDSAEQIRGQLINAGITHLLLRFDLFEFWASKNLEAEKQEILKIFFLKYAMPLESYGGYGLFQITIYG